MAKLDRGQWGTNEEIPANTKLGVGYRSETNEVWFDAPACVCKVNAHCFFRKLPIQKLVQAPKPMCLVCYAW